MNLAFRDITGGICAPRGYEAAGVVCGVKSASGPAGGKDLALARSLFPAACVGVFTTNAVKSAHVPICQKRIAAGPVQAIIVNSGIANCLYGKQGTKDALALCSLAEELLGLQTGQALILSTGLIGHGLPMAKIQRGLKKAARGLSPKGAAEAAWAITTTDTHPKQTAVEIKIGGQRVRIGGMAKGAGMISPNMATMLAFLTTDAALPARTLQTCLKRAVEQSFNRISIDGDMSPSDTVLLLANGAAEVTPKGVDLQLFQEGLNLVAARLARMVVEDGEGATKLITITVQGAPTNAQAVKIARAIGNSALVKCAFHGADPNWGRILTAAGGAGVKFDVNKAALSLAGIPLFSRGEPLRFSAKKAHQALLGKEVEVSLHLHSGPGCATILTCDLSEEYVAFNAEYHT